MAVASGSHRLRFNVDSLSSPAAHHHHGCRRRHNIACSSTSSLKVPPPASTSTSNKRALVFCDEANGIVCYRAFETGEVTCEGFDEGPYFDPLLSPPSTKSSRVWQDLSSPKNTLCHFEPKTQWDDSLQMLVFEGFDEG